ncbi:uncharacterized protein LOC141595547 [Silene latifolia]|uniref:uncharacterized protein LOC141595547 n=1 Tax=Silene latifolia TaxID=37657 RepID=UPI003D788F85
MRRLATQLVSSGVVIASTFMVWELVILLAGCEPPIAVVYHGSMGPAFRKGDILWLQKNQAPVPIGEIVVFKVNEESAPIVHRVITVHQRRDTGEVSLLTKGDNNSEDDRGGTYTEGRLWLTLDQVYGRVRWYWPYLGRVIIWVAMERYIKYPVIGAVVMYLLASKKP